MQDMQAHLEKIRAQIVECERFRKTAKSKIKRDIFKRLAARYRILAGELERAIAASHRAQDAFPRSKTYAPFPKEDDE